MGIRAVLERTEVQHRLAEQAQLTTHRRRFGLSTMAVPKMKVNNMEAAGKEGRTQLR